MHKWRWSIFLKMDYHWLVTEHQEQIYNNKVIHERENICCAWWVTAIYFLKRTIFSQIWQARIMMHVQLYVSPSDILMASCHLMHTFFTFPPEVSHSLPLETNNIHCHNFLVTFNMYWCTPSFSHGTGFQSGILFLPIVIYSHCTCHLSLVT